MTPDLRERLARATNGGRLTTHGLARVDAILSELDKAGMEIVPKAGFQATLGGQVFTKPGDYDSSHANKGESDG